MLTETVQAAKVKNSFSSASNSTTGKRNKVSDHDLEREVMLKRNKHVYNQLVIIQYYSVCIKISWPNHITWWSCFVNNFFCLIPTLVIKTKTKLQKDQKTKMIETI